MHNLSANALREMNEEFKDQPEALARIYKTQTGEHRYLPAHNMYEGDQYRAMNEALSEQIDILVDIYTHKSRLGELPAHTADTKDQLRAMDEALSGRPDILAQIYAAKDRYDNLPGYRIKQ